MAKQALGVAWLLLADAALAHPGHGVAPAASWLHGLEPAHLAPALLAGAVLLGFAMRRRSARVRERRR